MSDDTPTPKKATLKKGGKWIPRKWRIEYDRVIGYSALGKTNRWIAANMGYTPEHVSAIICCPQGQELLNKLQSKIRADIEQNVPEVLAQLAQDSVRRLKTVLTDEALFDKAPFQVVDRGLELLKGLKHLTGGGNGAPQSAVTTNIGTINITAGQKSEILEGLQKIEEVRKLNSGK